MKSTKNLIMFFAFKIPFLSEIIFFEKIPEIFCELKPHKETLQ